ncbi:MAG: hypothetical protein HY566_00255 [Candidatus Kerfeldbacteria bacterium]|nr:hypothetical protein [Candidatus Kerfeldbacteria bacterium]
MIGHAAFILAFLVSDLSAQDSLKVQETNWLSTIRQTRQAVERAFGDAATFTEGQRDHQGAFIVHVVPRDSLDHLGTRIVRKPYAEKAIDAMLHAAKLRCTPPGNTLVIRVWRRSALLEHRLARPLVIAAVPYAVLADSLLTADVLRSAASVDSSMAQTDGMPDQSRKEQK